MPSTAPHFFGRRLLSRRVLIPAAICLALVAGVKTLVFPPGPPPMPPGAPVSRGDIELTVLATGKLEASKLVSIGAQASGQIKSLKVALGQQVTKGQLIAEIDSLTQENALHRAEASLKDTRAQRLAKEALHHQAMLTFAREEKMLAEDASTHESYESAEATLKTTEADIRALDAQIEQAVIAVDTAKVDLGYTRITAPMDGTVVAVIAQEGQTVNAAQTTPTIVKLAQLSTMTVKAEISEADVTKVAPGQEVYFTILGEPDHRYSARLRSIKPAPASVSDDSSTTSTSSSSSGSSSSSSTSSAIYYDGLFDVPNPDGKLRISMTAKVSIVLAKAKDVLLIPTAAFDDPNPDGSYRVRVQGPGGRPEMRDIHIGINNNVTAQVLDGLRQGEQVVVGEPPKITPTSQSGMRPPPPGAMGF